MQIQTRTHIAYGNPSLSMTTLLQNVMVYSHVAVQANARSVCFVHEGQGNTTLEDVGCAHRLTGASVHDISHSGLLLGITNSLIAGRVLPVAISSQGHECCWIHIELLQEGFEAILVVLLLTPSRPTGSWP